MLFRLFYSLPSVSVKFRHIFKPQFWVWNIYIILKFCRRLCSTDLDTLWMKPCSFEVLWNLMINDQISIWLWCHNVDALSASLTPFVRKNQRRPLDSCHKGPAMQYFGVLFFPYGTICWTNNRVTLTSFSLWWQYRHAWVFWPHETRDLVFRSHLIKLKFN